MMLAIGTASSPAKHSDVELKGFSTVNRDPFKVAVRRVQQDIPFAANGRRRCAERNCLPGLDPATAHAPQRLVTCRVPVDRERFQRKLLDGSVVC
jgi:hypothetical protein